MLLVCKSRDDCTEESIESDGFCSREQCEDLEPWVAATETGLGFLKTASLPVCSDCFLSKGNDLPIEVECGVMSVEKECVS